MSWLKRIPFRESRNFLTIWAVIFATLLTVRITVDRPEKEERRIEKYKAEGRVISPESYVPVWLYKGLQANLVLAGVMLLAGPWLGRRRRPEAGASQEAKPPKFQKWEIVACIVVMGYAAWQNSPRLYHAMWGDEEFNASRFILDSPERQPDGSIIMEERSWVTTLWNMRKPTNHLGYSAVARLTHDTFFEKTTGPSDPWFSEPLLRAPVFIAGLLTIPALIWALRVWGLRPWLALALFVVHPWFVRFGVDGRGYGFVLLGVTLLIGVLGRALQTGRWGWWIAFGLGQFFVMWSNMQALYPCVAFNLVAVASLMRRDWVLVGRWVTANFVTVLFIVGYMAPCWPQLQEFMAKGEIKGSLDGRWWLDCMTAWVFGQPWLPWDEPTNPYMSAMQLSMRELPWLHVVGILAVAVTLLTGLVALCLRASWRPLILFTMGAPAIMVVHMTMTGNRPYDWYFCGLLPGLLVLPAAAHTTLARRGRLWLTASVLLPLILMFAYVTRIPRSMHRAHPVEQTRESVAVYRKITNPRHPDIEKEVISGAFTMYSEGYDPALRRYKDVAGLNELMAEADRTGKKLYVNVGFLKFVRNAPGSKDACAVLEDRNLFDHMSTLYGQLPYTTRDVFSYRGRKP